MHEGRRFKWCWAQVALLLALVAVGLGLTELGVPRERPAAAEEDTVGPLVREYQAQAERTSLSLREILAHPHRIPTHRHALVGQPAPDCELTDCEGTTWDLKQARAQGPVVLVFYYGFHCDHCVRQLFDMQRDLPLFREAGAQVMAVSADPPEWTRQRFREFGRFAFPVLSDPGNKVARAYQVCRADSLRHGTFIVDQGGTVRWANVGDAPFRCNAALLAELASLCAPRSP